jgi:hypothetical protein
MALSWAASMSILTILMAIIIGGVALSVIVTFMRGHRFRVRDALSKNKYIRDYLMVEKKEKETGIIWWKSAWWQRRIVIPEPPQEAICVGARGKKYVEGYRVSEDEFIWISDRGIKLRMENGRLIAEDILDDGKYKKIDSFNPFTAVQRQVLVNQRIKAIEISKKKWSTAEIMGIVSMGALMIVIVVGMIFGSDILKAYNNVQKTSVEITANQAEITKNQALLMQALGVNVDQLKVSTTQSPGAKQNTGIQVTGTTPPTNG